MATIHLRKPILLSGAVSVSLATLAVETSAQSRPTPERPLSDAMAEALRGPFHGDLAPPGSPGHDLLLSSTASPRGLADRVGVGASPSPQPPGVQIPAPAGAPSAEDGTPSRGKVFLLTTLAAAAGHAWSFYWPVRCGVPGDTPLLGDPAGPFVNPAAETKEDALCPTENETVLFFTGGLATTMMTGSVATLAGRGFWRSLAGSTLGYAGGLAAAAGTFLAVDELGLGWEWEDATVERVGMGVLILGQAVITTLFSN